MYSMEAISNHNNDPNCWTTRLANEDDIILSYCSGMCMKLIYGFGYLDKIMLNYL